MTGSDVGMQVVDLSPLPYNNPNYVTTYQNINQSHNLWIDNNGLAFIEHVGGDNIHIANLSNPSNPVYENTFGNLGSGCHDIFTQNNLAYVSEGWNSSFSISLELCLFSSFLARRIDFFLFLRSALLSIAVSSVSAICL